MLKKKYTGQIVLNLIFILLVIFAVAPLLIMIASSFTDEGVLLREGYNFWPKQFSLGAYDYLFRSSNKLIKACGVTVIVTLIGTVVNVMLTVLYAYPISRKELPFRGFFSFYIFFTMLFNGGLVPTYMMWTQTFGIKNTIWALIVPRLMMSAFYIIMMRSYFQSSIPESIVESARIDGAGEFRVLFSIVLPLSKPMLATISLMVGIAYWNDWTNSLYYITNENLFSIQAMLNTMLTNIQFLASSAGSISGAAVTLPSASVRMAIAVVGAVPILCIYPFFQKFFVKGIVVGGVKG